MNVQKILIDVIVADFLQPTIDRLSEQLLRKFTLNVILALDNNKVQRSVSSAIGQSFDNIDGEARIVASDSAIEGRYKYSLQCLFAEDPELHGFSGITSKGAVELRDPLAKNDYRGFAYQYNDWAWGKTFRDF